MSKYITKYFQFIGVENEGLKRIILTLMTISLLVGGCWYYSYSFHTLFGLDGLFNYDDLFDFLLIVLGTFISFSIVLRTITWVEEGFWID